MRPTLYATKPLVVGNVLYIWNVGELAMYITYCKQEKVLRTHVEEPPMHTCSGTYHIYIQEREPTKHME